MTPEAQRIAIAEACGITQISSDWWGWIFAGIEYPGDLPPHVKVPDYLNDLNAMHEAEEGSHIFQSWRDSERWLDELELAVIGRKAESRPDLSFVFRAKAPQRARAFLKTLYLWQD
jgi:hypothetical protein